MKKPVYGNKTCDLILVIMATLGVLLLCGAMWFSLSGTRCSSCDERLMEKGTTDGSNVYCDRCVSICMEEARIEQGKLMHEPIEMLDMDIYQRGLELLRERSK